MRAEGEGILTWLLAIGLLLVALLILLLAIVLLVVRHDRFEARQMLPTTMCKWMCC
jgi:hypothetical protein